MADHLHVWMPPRSGGLQAKAELMGERKLKMPGGVVITFTPVEADDPDYCWRTRWCLGCREQHPVDVTDAENIIGGIRKTLERLEGSA